MKILPDKHGMPGLGYDETTGEVTTVFVEDEKGFIGVPYAAMGEVVQVGRAFAQEAIEQVRSDPESRPDPRLIQAACENEAARRFKNPRLRRWFARFVFEEFTDAYEEAVGRVKLN
jgi:hypothetical protein